MRRIYYKDRRDDSILRTLLLPGSEAFKEVSGHFVAFKDMRVVEYGLGKVVCSVGRWVVLTPASPSRWRNMWWNRESLLCQVSLGDLVGPPWDQTLVLPLLGVALRCAIMGWRREIGHRLMKVLHTDAGCSGGGDDVVRTYM